MIEKFRLLSTSYPVFLRKGAFYLPATCVRMCMLSCSKTSGSLYSPAFPVSTSSSFTFTWFCRSRNNLQSHSGVSLSFFSFLPSFKNHTRGTHCQVSSLVRFQLTSLSAPEIVFPDPTSHLDILLSCAHSLHHPSLHRGQRDRNSLKTTSDIAYNQATI